MATPSRLLEALDEVGAAVETAPHVCVFLDFDGTLAPIAESPELVNLPVTTRAMLQSLARRPGCTVGIVSGRALDDVRQRVGIEGLVYAGNHGLEISGGGLRFVETMAIRVRNEISRTMGVLADKLGGVPGVLVEPKGLTGSIHYRQAAPADWCEIETAVRETVPDDHSYLRTAPGKMVWEVRPKVDWNKGSAVRWIRERLALGEALTFYLGDDHTDEDAFAEVGPFVTARVGGIQPTRAGFHVNDTGEVMEFLHWLSRTVPRAQRVHVP